MSCLLSEQKLCKVKLFQLQSDKPAMYWSKVFVKNSGIACLALIFNLSYPRSTIRNLLQHLGHFQVCLALSQSVHWHSTCFLYCWAPNNFIFLGFRQWWSHRQGLTLNTKIRLPVRGMSLRLEAIKPLQLVGQAAQFKFESKFAVSPCLSSGNPSEGYSRM